MPRRLVFVRHGESEANLIHKAERDGEMHNAHDEVYARHDWEQRLSAKGVEQAKAAGKWITQNILPIQHFDRRYVSTFQRAVETALYMCPDVDVDWHVDDRFREREWGEFGATPYEERKRLFPWTQRAYETNSFYAQLNGGESLSQVQMRVRDTFGTYHRDVPDGSVLVVAHGELITMNRYLIERMLPEEIVAVDNDKTQDMKNCTIIEYTRENPEDNSDVRPHLSWMRMIYPYDVDVLGATGAVVAPQLEQSPFRGQWQPINERRLLSRADLLARLALSPPLTH